MTKSLFIALMLFVALIAGQPAHAQNVMQDGVNAYQAKEYDKAIELFTQSISQYPQFANQMYYNRGLSYSAKGDLANAKADFEKACQMGYQLGCDKAQELGSVAVSATGSAVTGGITPIALPADQTNYYPRMVGDKLILWTAYKIYCYNAMTGAEIWNISIEETGQVSFPSISTKYLVYSYYTPNEQQKTYQSGIVAFDLNTGQRLWKTTMSDYIWDAAYAADDGIYAIKTVGKFEKNYSKTRAKKAYTASLSIENGNQNWCTELKKGKDYGSAIIGTQGNTMYVAIHSDPEEVKKEDLVMALDRSDGKESWKIDKAGGYVTGYVINDKAIFFKVDGEVKAPKAGAYNMDTGKKLWKAGLFDVFGHGSEVGAAAIGPNMIFAGKTGNMVQITCFDALKGDKVYREYLHKPGMGENLKAAASAAAGGLVGTVLGVTGIGALVELGSGISSLFSKEGPGGRVLYGSFSNLDDDGYYRTSLFADACFFTVLKNGKIKCVTVNDGKTKWTFQLDKNATGFLSNKLLGNNLAVYTGGKVLMLNAADGSKVSELVTDLAPEENVLGLYVIQDKIWVVTSKRAWQLAL